MKTKLRFLATAFLAAITVFTTAPGALAQTGWGNALSFDGLDDYVQAGNVPLTNASFTLEAWARRDSAGTMDFILGQGSPSTSMGLHFGFHGVLTVSNMFVFGFYNDDLFTTNRYTDTNWHHWAGTYNAGNKARCIYRDGILVASNTATANYQGSGSLFFGRDAWGTSGMFRGSIDDVRIWNVARTAEEIKQHVNQPLSGTESNLVAYWKFDEGSGASAQDATTNSCDGTLVNGPQWTPSTIPLWGSALSLDGVDDHVTIPQATWFSNEFTIETWVYERSYKNFSRVIDFGNGEAAQNVILALSYGTAGNPYLELTGSGGLTAPSALPTNQWVHLAATVKTNWGAIYVNGIMVTSGTVGAAAAVNRTRNYIGRSNWAANSYANAIFEDLRIWNIARTPAQIREGMCHPLTGTESNLLANWNFDEAGGTVVYDATASHMDGTLVNGPVWINSTIPPFVNIIAGLPGISDSSIAWGDYDNDGRLDILMTGTTNYLNGESGAIAQVWRNTGNGFSNINAGLPGVVFGTAAWGDYNNDGRLDILLAGMSVGYHQISQVWRNTGNGFSNINAGLPGVWYGESAWGDYDNDGRLDILLTGEDESFIPVAQIWRNTGSGFTNINAGLPGVFDGAAAWGDYDNDGRLDIVLTSGNVPFSQVWRNTGSGFTNINAGLPGMDDGSVAWGDYDNDGRLDILLRGEYAYHLYAVQVWRNTGSGFTNINAALPVLYDASVAWGDYDNDGRLDILFTGGYPGTLTVLAQVWRNTGSGFTNIVDIALPGVKRSTAAWGDYDNDGRLDILLTGMDESKASITRLYRNNVPVANTPPQSPSGLTTAAAGGGIMLGWNPASDPQTPAKGLTYNISVGSAPGAFDVVSPQATLTNGFRRVPALGNSQHGSTTLVDLPWGIYYWRVQAVDTAFAGSPFAAEAQFVVAVKTQPATYLSHESRTLRGQVNPLGYPATAWFQWGDTTSYGHTTTATNPGSGTIALPVSCVVTGWATGTYHFRIVATNDLGLHVGADNVFTIQSESPTVVALPPTGVTATSATLQSKVNPRWAETFAWFEYGLTTKYGNATPAANLGSGPDALPFASAVTGLLPWMTYHCRTVASNSVGVTISADATLPLPGSQPGAPALSGLNDLILPQGSNTVVGFTVSDPDTPLNELNVKVRCNNPVLLPGSGILLGGSEGTRSLTLVPAANHSGSAAITVSVTDDANTTSDTFLLTVPPGSGGSLMYLTNAQAVSAEAWRFRLVDAGSGCTNYAVEYLHDLSSTNGWIVATNVTALGGGEFEVDTGPPQPDMGFYRIKGFRLLTAGLGSTDFTVDEGAGLVGPVIIFNGPYVGTVNFSWTGTWGTSNGTVQVNGTTAVIPIPLTENTDLNQLQYLTLRLQAGSGYALGGAQENSVTIEENDAEWQGVLQTQMGALGFVLRINQNNSGLQGALRSDRLGFFPTNAPGLPLAELRFTEDTFVAVATNVSLNALAGSPLFSTSHFVQLRLDAANGQTNQSVGPASVEGVATLVSVVPGRPYLDTAVSGTFLLLKPPVIPSTNEVPLYVP